MNRSTQWILFILFIISFEAANATHLRCGEISVIQVGEASSLTFKIRVTVYMNTNNTAVMFGGDQDYLNLGDGSPSILVPEISPGHPNYEYVDGARGITRAYYEITHTYAGPGQYIVSYQEPNRNTGILNIDTSENTIFYLETKFTCGWRNYSSPKYLAPPIFLTSVGPYSFSLGAEDPNDYTLFYKLATPGAAVNFQLPEGLQINEFNGLITWDGMFKGEARVGEFLLAVKTYQFDGNVMVGYSMRDVQIIVEESTGSRLVSDDQNLDENGRLFVAPNEERKIKLIAQGGEDMTMEVFSPFTEGDEVVSFESYDSLAGQLRVGNLTISSSEDFLRDNPYIVTVRTSFSQFHTTYTLDRNYMFYSKDIEIQQPVVLDVNEQTSGVHIFPNPTSDFVQVGGIAKNKMRLLDINGHPMPLILEGDYVDLRLLPAGLYLLEIQAINQKIIRERIVRK